MDLKDLFNEEMNAAKKLNERVNVDIARIDEMLEKSNYSPEENEEKRGINLFLYFENK